EDLPFSIHFHLHPDVSCDMGLVPNTADVRLADGQIWRLEVAGAELAIEESTFFANSTGPRGSMQIVLRAATFGESDVSWSITRVDRERFAGNTHHEESQE